MPYKNKGNGLSIVVRKPDTKAVKLGTTTIGKLLCDPKSVTN